MKTYFALSIGPIYKSLATAKGTSEIWAASYVFSYLMEKIVSSEQLAKHVILPVPVQKEERFKAGLYPDRMILELPENDIQPGRIVNKVFNYITDEIFGKENEEEKKFFRDYFQLYSFTITLPDNENPVKKIFQILASMEQKPSFVPVFETNYFKSFLVDAKNWKKFKQIYGAGFHFPSVPAIAASSLSKIDPIEEKIVLGVPDTFKTGKRVFDSIFRYCLEHPDESSPNECKLLKMNYPDHFRNYHKYMAIVQADGDNFGRITEALYETDGVKSVKKFSVFLSEYGKCAYKIIENYGGTAIYLGGDDLLFFAPVKTMDSTIFTLINELESLFKTMLSENEFLMGKISEWNSGATLQNRRKKLSAGISFSLSVAYHKFPLKEWLEENRNLLFEVAKNVPEKSCIVMRLRKHSGHTIEASWKFEWRSYKLLFSELLHFENLDENFLSSLQYKIDPLKPALIRILSGRKIDPAKPAFVENIAKFFPNESSRKFFLNRLLENFFNEMAHNDARVMEFLKLAMEYLLQVYRDMEDVYGNNEETAEKAVDSLYAALRINQFLIQKDKNEEEEN